MAYDVCIRQGPSGRGRTMAAQTVTAAGQTARERITAAPGAGDVIVRATLDVATGVVMVRARITGRAARWTEPLPSMVRELVDELAAENGRRRIGRRGAATSDVVGWTYVYST